MNTTVSDDARGLTVYVYRCPIGECSRDGVTARYDEVFLTGEGVKGPRTAKEARDAGQPILVVNRRELGGKTYISAVPENAQPMQHCFGGNLIFCSDSRFCDINESRAIPVHDRDEGKPLDTPAGRQFTKRFKYNKIWLNREKHVLETIGDGEFLVHVSQMDGTVAFRGIDGRPLDMSHIPLNVMKDVSKWINDPYQP